MTAWFGANGIGDREGGHVETVVAGIKTGSGSAAQGLKNAAQGGKMGAGGNKGARETVGNAVTKAADRPPSEGGGNPSEDKP